MAASRERDGTPRPAADARATGSSWCSSASSARFSISCCFVGGVERTSVGNGSLIIGISPIVIALMSAVAGHERIKPMRWVGVAVALFGLYLVVGHGVDLSGRRGAAIR